MADKKPSQPDDIKRQISELDQRITELRKEIAQIRDTLNHQDNWHAEIKTMFGKEINYLLAGHNVWESGELLWSDRYNICVKTGKCKRRVIPKGGLIWIELA